jgi:hypothetical protein
MMQKDNRRVKRVGIVRGKFYAQGEEEKVG